MTIKVHQLTSGIDIIGTQTSEDKDIITGDKWLSLRTIVRDGQQGQDLVPVSMLQQMGKCPDKPFSINKSAIAFFDIPVSQDVLDMYTERTTGIITSTHAGHNAAGQQVVKG